MTVQIEPRHTAAYLVSEANGSLSRDVVTLAQGNKLAPGTVLGHIEGTTKYTALNFAANDGSEIPVAILFDHVDATESDRAAVITARHAEVNAAELVWPAGATEAQITEAMEALADTLAIVAR